MNNINKIIEEYQIEKKHMIPLWMRERGLDDNDTLNMEETQEILEDYLYEIKKWLTKALKTQEQEHQNKLEELKRLCVGEKRVYTPDKPASYAYIRAWNKKRQEIKEIFNKQ